MKIIYKNMKMISYFKLTLSVFCSILLTSCNLIDFSEDCSYYGDVEIRPVWSGLAEDEMKPTLTDIYLLSPQNNYNYRISADTLIKDIHAVSYNVLAFNSYRLENISFSGMDCPNTAKVEVSTYEKDGRLYTVQAPVFYAANTNLEVIPYEKVICEPVLKYSVRQINIDFVVVDNMDTGVSGIDGELSGIAYRFDFRELDALESSAWLAFGSVSHEEKNNVFSSNLRVFGVNPDKQMTGNIDNLLDIALQTTDGSTYSQSIDLTDVFSGFTTRIINITIEIRLGMMGIEVEITGWNVSDGGIIEL